MRLPSDAVVTDSPGAPAPRNPGAGHYFEPEPTAASRPRDVELHLPDLSLRLQTDRGVFAAAAIDPGTKLLLLDGPAPRTDGVLVDLGCGYGPIAIALAKRSPAAQVFAVDVNRRALALCAANAVANGATNVRALEAAEVPDHLRVDELWSNPPIRVGKTALHQLLLSWLVRLTPDGRALLVVQKHLGSDSLARWLVEQGWPTERRESRGGYRILEVLARP
ncbi:MAG: rRNA (guanine1207-N2)-methyltransferase [Acidimicrobiaceae bacterium]|jgi:16S rRNA (guanine1207-N2)-methyltransferase